MVGNAPVVTSVWPPMSGGFLFVRLTEIARFFARPTLGGRTPLRGAKCGYPTVIDAPVIRSLGFAFAAIGIAPYYAHFCSDAFTAYSLPELVLCQALATLLVRCVVVVGP